MGTAECGARAEDGGDAPHSRWSTRSLRISLLTQKKNPKQIRAWGSTVLPQFKASGRTASGCRGMGRCRPADLVTHR